MPDLSPAQTAGPTPTTGDPASFRELILKGCYDLGRHGLRADNPEAAASLASLVANASRLGSVTDNASLRAENERMREELGKVEDALVAVHRRHDIDAMACDTFADEIALLGDVIQSRDYQIDAMCDKLGPAEETIESLRAERDEAEARASSAISAADAERIRLRAENEAKDVEIAKLLTDAKRLDALEKYAVQNCEDGDRLDFAEVESTIDEESDDLPDDEAHITYEFTVHAPRTSWGSRLGHGADLREAIDDAMQWERAVNRDNMGQSAPIMPEDLEGQ